MNHATTFVRIAYAMLAALFASSLLPAQGAWSRANDQPGFGIGGRVFHLGTFRNELIAGTYRNVWRDGNTLNHIARFDGVRWYPLGTGVDGSVRSSCEFQNMLYVGGSFSTAGGQLAQNIARWNGTSWQPVGAGLNGTVWSLLEHQGQLYAAGEFSQSGGAAVSGIARWNGTSWQPVGGGLTWNFGVYHVGYDLASDGTSLYVGGSFDRAGSVPASHIAAWNGTSWHALGSGINNFGWGWVRTLALHNGKLYAGGAFGQAGSALSENIAAWDPSNGTWSAVGAGVGGTVYGTDVWDLRVYRGELYVSGSFNHSGNTPLARIARFDGVALQPIGGVEVAETNPPAILAMTTWNDRLYCGGEFHVAGQPLTALTQTAAVYHITAYDGSTWSAVGGGFGFGNEVFTLGRYRGEVIAGGRFREAGGSYAGGLARFDGNDWRHLGTFDGAVRDMVEFNGDLWVAGEFYSVDNIVANGVARFDGTRWHALGAGPSGHGAYAIVIYRGMIHVGTIGSPLRWNGSVWETFTPQIFGALTALHVHNDVLYMGGDTPFQPGAPNIFAWNGTTLSVPGGGTNAAVGALTTFNGNLVAGGAFTRAGGVSALRIASFDGVRWTQFGTGVRGGGIADFATFQGSLVIGGDFSRFQGENADYVARWDGARWQPFGNTAPNGAVYTLLADDARGELHVGGWYFQNGAQDDAYYSLWQSTPSWTDVGTGLGTSRRTPRLTGDGSLLVGARTRWRLSSALENAPAAFVLGLQRVNQPLLGGTLIPSLDVVLPITTDAIGTTTLQAPFPALPGLQFLLQAWVFDPAGPQGATASNGVWMRAP